MIGYDSAFIGTTLALPSFVDEFNFAEYSESRLALLKQNIVSVYQAGAFFGSLFAYFSSYFFGRRKTLMLFTLVFIVGAGMMLGASAERGLGLILGGRVLAGLGVGGCSNMTPIYISELSPPAVRGRLVGIYELGWQIGGLVGFWINYGVNTNLAPSHSQWLIPFAVQLIPAGLLLIGAILIPESPRWLFSKGKREKATSVLCWMRNLEPTDTYIREEIGYIDEEFDRFNREVGSGFWRPFRALKEKRIQWRFLLSVLFFMFQNGKYLLCGFNADLTNKLSRLRHQCYQLLQPYCVPQPWYHRDKYRFPDDRYFRSRQDSTYSRLAPRAHRPPGSPYTFDDWKSRWFPLHVVHWRLHQSIQCRNR
jgi:sugar porter (SP) family MFS transporter